MREAAGTEAKNAAADILPQLLEDCLAGQSERQKQLLKYLVTEELEGRGERIKAFSIATDVLGRADTFDAQTDSIVRVEMARLRNSLNLYYATTGSGNSVRIHIPKGQYRPNFELMGLNVDAAPGMTAPAASIINRVPKWIWAVLILFVSFQALVLYGVLATKEPKSIRIAPRVAVAPFDISADRPGMEYIASGLQGELISILSEFDWLGVFPLNVPPKIVNSFASKEGSYDYLIVTTAQLVSEQLKTSVLLLDGSTGAVRWAKHYDGVFAADDILTTQRDMATHIALDIGLPDGAVANLVRSGKGEGLITDEALICELKTKRYRGEISLDYYLEARKCFANLPVGKQRDSSSIASLVLLLLDARNFGDAPGISNKPIEEILLLAEEAMRLNPTNSQAQIARYSVAACMGDQVTLQRIGARNVKNFPNNPSALFNYGLNLAFAAEGWEEALKLLERANNINPTGQNWYRMTKAANALQKGDELAALTELPRESRSRFAPFLLIELAVYTANKDEDSERKVRDRLVELGFPDRISILSMLENQCWTPDIKKKIRSYIDRAIPN